jgi:putative ABC transport system permease protein
MKQLLLQAFNLIRQNPFYATISIIGTAVTIAFVMVVVMIYDSVQWIWLRKVIGAI